MNELEKILNEKLTENGDLAYKSTGSELLDILFMSPYFEKHLDEVSIGTSNKEKLFSMFMRDPRYGLGRRDLGRELMKKSGVSPKAGSHRWSFSFVLSETVTLSDQIIVQILIFML